jgi:hypothetical protein
VLVGMKVAAFVAGRRDAVVEAMVLEVVYWEGVYFEESRRRRGTGSTEDVVELIISQAQMVCEVDRSVGITPRLDKVLARTSFSIV